MYFVGVSISESPGPDVFTTELNEADYPGLRKDQQQKNTTQRSGFKSKLMKIKKWETYKEKCFSLLLKLSNFVV